MGVNPAVFKTAALPVRTSPPVNRQYTKKKQVSQYFFAESSIFTKQIEKNIAAPLNKTI
jgi:hypothetical protein